MARGKAKKPKEAKAPGKPEMGEEVEATAQPEMAELEKTPVEGLTEAARKEIEEVREEEAAAEAEEGVEAETKNEEAEPEEAPEEEEGLEIVEEKFYDLNLRRLWSAPREKRTPKAVRFLREYIGRRMKTDEVSISEATNRMLWARGISKPPRKIRVRAVKDKDGRVIIFPGEGK